MISLKRSLGIIGGMGPQATVDFMQRLVSMTEVSGDADHMRVYADSHPQIPNRVAAILSGGESPLPAMLQSLEKLQACGAEVIAMPCITAHYFMEGLLEQAKVEMLDMRALTVDACLHDFPGKTAAVLSTVATAKSGLLTSALQEKGVSCIIPDEAGLQEMGQLILNVKANHEPERTVARFEAIVADLQEKGADYFVLACTEIPIMAQQSGISIAYVDPTAQLAKAAILACGYPLRA